MTTTLDQRFFSSTRGQIVLLLRRTNRTVEELAQALDLTDNAIRAHLTGLERDGLVRQQGVRRGAGKPAYAYELAAGAEQLFPKADAPVLGAILTVLGARLSRAELAEVLHAAGQQMAADVPAPPGDLPARLAAAVALLNELGALVEAEEDGGRLVLRGYSCPLAGVVPQHPELCEMVAALLTEFVGVPVQEQCNCGPPARCCFLVDG